MSQAPFPLEAWCNRRPRLRYALVLLLVVVLWGVAGAIDTGVLWGSP